MTVKRLLMGFILCLTACQPPSSDILTPPPNPSVSTQRVKAAFRASGFHVVSGVSTMQASDYEGAPQICYGEYFNFFDGGDVGSRAFVFQCKTQSNLDRIKQFYMARKRAFTVTISNTLVFVPTNYVVPGHLDSIEFMIKNCESFIGCKED